MSPMESYAMFSVIISIALLALILVQGHILSQTQKQADHWYKEYLAEKQWRQELEKSITNRNWNT